MRNWFEFFTHIKKDGQFRQDQRALIDYDKAKGLDNYKGVKRNNEL